MGLTGYPTTTFATCVEHETMTAAAQRVLNHLNLTKEESGKFKSTHENEGWQQVFGGQLMAQAVVAATHTVPEDKSLASFQCTFIAPGDVALPLYYHVETLQFSMRSVTAQQENRTCFLATIMFQRDDDGLTHGSNAPKVPPPAECADLVEMASAYQERFADHLGDNFNPESLPPQPIDMRFANIQEFLTPAATQSQQALWIKLDAHIDDDQERHKQVLAYASDQTIAHVVAQPHGLGGLNPRLRLVSLDHAMWFHQPIRANEWMLLVRDCPAAISGRALVRGSVYDESGALIASLTQQALARVNS